VARPSSYTPDVVDALIAAKTAGCSDADAAKAGGITAWTLYHWRKNRSEFRALYDHALAAREATFMVNKGCASDVARDRLKKRLEAQLKALDADFPAAA
jgi:hypothetical protein